MVDDSIYVIVPNQTQWHSERPNSEPARASNENGRYVAELIKDGYRIITKMGNRDAIHYVLIKFKPNSRPSGRAAMALTEDTPEEDDKLTPGVSF